MQQPPSLQSGDKIGLICTAKRINFAEIEHAVKLFEAWGLKVVVGKTLHQSYNQFAGTDEERAADLQQMLDDDSIRAVICARGGYGTVRIIDRINFSKFAKTPKWIVGYSDVCVLHAHIHQNFGIETLHATMPINFPKEQTDIPALQSLKDALFGNSLKYKIASNQLNRPGSAEGQVIGGNLSVLYSLCGSKSDISTEGKILFLEDLTEYLYHIDRMMMNFKRSGKLEKLKGLVVGGFTEMEDNEVPFGKTAEEIIIEAVKEYEYPVCFGFPGGHFEDNRALIFGRKARFEVSHDGTFIKFEQ